MKLNGAAVYAGDYAGLVKQDWGYFTKNTTTGKYYAVVCYIPVSGALRVKLAKGQRLGSATLGGRKLTIKEIAANEYFIMLTPMPYPQPPVVEFEVEGGQTGSGNKYQDAKT